MPACRSENFEWFIDPHADLVDALDPLIPRERPCHILHVGCGSSDLGESIYMRITDCMHSAVSVSSRCRVGAVLRHAAP